VILKFIESIGDKTINLFLDFVEATKFMFLCIIHMLTPSSYNPAMRMVLTKQIYFTSVGILPLFMMMAMLSFLPFLQHF